VIGAYAVNKDGKSKIVLCPPYFKHKSLDGKRKVLNENLSLQHDSFSMKSSGHVFLHETMHLAVVERGSPGKHNSSDPAGPIAATCTLPTSTVTDEPSTFVFTTMAVSTVGSTVPVQITEPTPARLPGSAGKDCKWDWQRRRRGSIC
jgi:hypothetical protein